jgi:hypothetical protein
MYELLEMGLPSHALNEHVQLAKRGVNEGAGRFTNGARPNPSFDIPVTCKETRKHSTDSSFHLHYARKSEAPFLTN